MVIFVSLHLPLQGQRAIVRTRKYERKRGLKGPKIRAPGLKITVNLVLSGEDA